MKQNTVQRVRRETFLRELEAVSPGLSTRGILDQSSSFVFREGEVFTFNDEICCSHASCLDGIEGAVSSEPLLAILRKLTEEEVDVVHDPDEGEVIIKGKNRQAGIRLDEEITLPIDDVETPQDWKDLPKLFAEAVGIVEDCAGKDESQFILTCVHIGEKWVEACDNFQLARFFIDTGFKDDCLVRRDSLKHIRSLDMTEFSETTTWLHFQNPAGLVLSCRRYAQSFPKLDRLLDVDGHETNLPTGLSGAIEKADIFSSENPDGDQIKVILRKGKIKIRGEGLSGWFEEGIRADYSGDPISFLISPKLLISLLKHQGGCQVSEDRLLVDGDHFSYVSCLGKDE